MPATFPTVKPVAMNFSDDSASLNERIIGDLPGRDGSSNSWVNGLPHFSFARPSLKEEEIHG